MPLQYLSFLLFKRMRGQQVKAKNRQLLEQLMTGGKISTLTSHQEIQTKTRCHFSIVKLSKIKVFYEHIYY